MTNNSTKDWAEILGTKHDQYLPEGEEDDGLDGKEFENRIVGPQEILRGEVEDN